MALVGLSLGCWLALHTMGCADEEGAAQTKATDPSLVSADGAACPPTLGSDAGVDRSSCIRCPGSTGSCPDLAAQPSYEQVRTTWLAECPPADGQKKFPIVSTGACRPSGHRFLQIHRGLGMERRYFDAQGALVGVLTDSDYIDPVCEGIREWPVHTSCDVQTPLEMLCGSFAR